MNELEYKVLSAAGVAYEDAPLISALTWTEVGLNAWPMMSVSFVEMTTLLGAVVPRLLPYSRQCAREDCIKGRLSRVEALNQLDEPGLAQKNGTVRR